MIEAGFAKSTARKSQKKTLKTALKRQEQQLIEQHNELGNSDKGTKEIVQEMKRMTLADKLGIDRQTLVNEFIKVLLQDRDLSTKLKALRPVLRDEGMDIGEEETTKVTVPVLNVTVKDNNMAQPSHDTE
jgi:predicted regulator of amino acid metabolism with ACT domain